MQNFTSIQRRFTLLLSLILCSALLWGADLKISWRDGKDNLYKHPARLIVTSTAKGKPTAGATIYRNEEPLGVTDSHGQFNTTTLNTAAVKYTLKACIDNRCSEKTSYQVVVSEYPYSAFISMGENPSTSMSFTWHTSGKIKVTLVEFVKADDKLGFQSLQALKTKGTFYVHEMIDVDKPEGKKYNVSIHKATINDLTPGTQYLYRIGDGKNWMEGSFRTAPEQGNSEEIKFLFLADSQESSRENYQSYFRKVISKACELNPDIRFVVHAGDMVNRGMNGQEWGWFFEAGEKFFKNLPFAPMVGNHETGGVVTSGPQQENLAYLSYFNNPSNHTGTFAEGSSYSFNFGTVHLLCLDNEDLFDAIEVQSKTGEKKYLESALDWIKKDLTTATLQNKWKVVTMHQPIYGANRDEDDLRKVLAPVFDKGKVDLVITGHDHYYFRSFPMKYDSLKNDGEIVPIDQFGTVYLIGGSTCAKMYPQKFAKPYQAVVMASGEFPGRYPTLRNDPLTLQNYSTFTASPAKLHYRFFDKNGNLKDEVVLQKLGKK
jgi:3',5'-cyclic AMP phosphodiesterase CpdA